jgi:hypothetical protein
MRGEAVSAGALRAMGVDSGWAEPIDAATLAAYAAALSGLYAAMDAAPPPAAEAEPAEFVRALAEFADERG